MTAVRTQRTRRKVASDDPTLYGATSAAGMAGVLFDTKAQDDGTIADALTILERRAWKVGAAFTSPDAAGAFCRLQLAQAEREHFGCAFLDNRHRLIAWEILFSGTIDGADVHPREVAKRALQLNACSVIFAHNHPSGSLEPSAADRAVTARLKQALAMLEVRVLDHFIVTMGGHTSMANLGTL